MNGRNETPKHLKDRMLADWCRRILKLLELDAPAVIVNHAVVSMFNLSLGCDKNVAEQFVQTIHSDRRQRCGFCQFCDNDIRTEDTHPPICDVCHGKFVKDAFVQEMEYPTEDNE